MIIDDLSFVGTKKKALKLARNNKGEFYIDKLVNLTLGEDIIQNEYFMHEFVAENFIYFSFICYDGLKKFLTDYLNKIIRSNKRGDLFFTMSDDKATVNYDHMDRAEKETKMCLKIWRITEIDNEVFPFILEELKYIDGNLCRNSITRENEETIFSKNCFYPAEDEYIKIFINNYFGVYKDELEESISYGDYFSSGCKTIKELKNTMKRIIFDNSL